MRDCFNKKNLIYCVFMLFLLFFSLSFKNASGSESKNATPKTTTFASLTFANLDSLWGTTEKLASDIQLLDLARQLRAYVISNSQNNGLDSTRSLGIKIASDGNDVFAFGYLPISSQDAFDDDVLQNLKTFVVQKYTNGYFDDVFVSGEYLILCSQKYREVISSSIKANVDILQSVSVSLFDINIDFSAVPKELVEAGFASFRQKISEKAGESSEISSSDLDMLLNYYSEVLSSISSVDIVGSFTESHSLMIEFSLKCKPNTVLAKEIETNRNAQTRWGAFTQGKNLIWCSVDTGSRVEQLKEFRLSQFKNITCKNLVEQLNLLLDSPDDYEFAKQVIDTLESEVLANIEKGTFDNAIALQGEPLVLIVASEIIESDKISNSLQQVFERVTEKGIILKENWTLNYEEQFGYSLSKIDFPEGLFPEEIKNYISQDNFSIRWGLSKDALVLACGFDSEDVEKDLLRILESSSTKTIVPRHSKFDFSQLAKLILDMLNQDSARSVAIKSLKKFADGQNVSMKVERTLTSDQFIVHFEVESGFFKTLGEVIKINLMGVLNGNREDNSVDLDNVFDE